MQYYFIFLLAQLHIFRQHYVYVLYVCIMPCAYVWSADDDVCLLWWNLRWTLYAKIERLNLCSKAFLQIESDKEKHTAIQNYSFMSTKILVFVFNCVSNYHQNKLTEQEIHLIYIYWVFSYIWCCNRDMLLIIILRNLIKRYLINHNLRTMRHIYALRGW